MKTNNVGSKTTTYKVFSVIILVILAFLFVFPLYWIVTGAFKPAGDIYAQKPVWWPSEWVMDNFNELLAKRSAPLWELHIPFSQWFSEDHRPVVFSAGPVVPAAFRWLINAVFMAATAMILTCLTAAMAGYALAKKRFRGRAILFGLIICAMALPKQVILIPLLKEMNILRFTDTLWAVIFPTVGWPFGVFLMKQFSESIPGEILEAARVLNMQPAALVELDMGYDFYGKATYILPQYEVQVTDSRFEEGVRLQLLCKTSRLAALTHQLRELSSGTVAPVILDERFAHFPEGGAGVATAGRKNPCQFGAPGNFE